MTAAANSPDPYTNSGISRRLSMAALLAALRAPAQVEPPLRLAISESLLPEVNVGDAKAAMMVWINRIGQEMGLSVDYGPRSILTGDEIVERLRRQALDAVAVNVIEYRRMASLLDPLAVVGNVESGAYRYVILVKRGAGIRRLGDLRKRHLIQLAAPNACVGPFWLSSLLAAEKAGRSTEFFSQVQLEHKPAKVILPVFFGQADACLTTWRNFQTMCELNPQVGEKLDVLATSTDLVSTCYVFRRNYRSPYRDRIIAALSGLKNSPSGQQVMLLFQIEDLKVRDVSCMNDAIRLLEAADRRGLDAGAMK